MCIYHTLSRLGSESTRKLCRTSRPSNTPSLDMRSPSSLLGSGTQTIVLHVVIHHSCSIHVDQSVVHMYNSVVMCAYCKELQVCTALYRN